MARKPAKHRPTPAQLANDPSLRWVPYRPFEVVWSTNHGAELRFVRYTADGEVVLASLTGMGELPGVVPALSVRRLTADKDWFPPVTRPGAD